MRIDVRILMSLLVLAANLAAACEPTYDQMLEMARRDRAIEEVYVRKLFSESDSVVVGVVTDVQDSDHREYAQLATVTVEKVLRGSSEPFVSFLMYKRGHAPAYTGDDDERPLESIPDCGSPQNPEQDQPYLQEGFRVLVYIVDGVLRRVSSFPIKPVPLSLEVEAEIDLLQRTSRGVRANEG